MRQAHYILDEHGNPQPCSVDIWDVWVRKPSIMTTVAKNRVENNGRIIELLTRFTGHDYQPSGPPFLWETLQFDLKNASYCSLRLYSSKFEALNGHSQILSELILPSTKNWSQYGF